MSDVDIVRALMQSYLSQDRDAAERLIADDFVFTSPQDDHIDRATFFERCFPASTQLGTQQILEVAAAPGDGVFVLYEYDSLTDGQRYRNAEYHTLRDGRVTTDTEFTVSARAQSMEGSRMFVEAGTSVPVEALIHGIIVQSGNDACVVVAEGLAGSEATFAEQMTKRAHELGMTNSAFTNASGLPEPGHHMSARDLVTLSRHIIDDFPHWESAHKIMMTNGIPGIENIGGDIDKITGKRCTFFAFPWRWPDGEGCALRVVAVLDPKQTFRFETGR